MDVYVTTSIYEEAYPNHLIVGGGIGGIMHLHR